MAEILGAFAQTSWVGKGVLLVLAIFSLVSWSLTFLKIHQLRRADRANGAFLEQFRRATRLGEVQSAASSSPEAPLAGMFRAGYLELEAQIRVLRRAGQDSGQIKSLAAVERALQRAIGVESARLQRFLPFLATTASATPFIGLFGTVWGIMSTFSSIAASGSTSIVHVAPGIAEALVNTAAGLAAAIPAVIAYNAFLGSLRRHRGAMEDFLLEFLNLTERTFT
ncbi:MAG: MotA/TolQ/ExbB proton channel family protein [Thermoanaerobaculaceae bacterium]|jgi:biopolymer transport protein TolQ|nr:MotA/TolQ/ExbB proton channel family protein [Thermoanaerobaculaceae bacterium]